MFKNILSFWKGREFLEQALGEFKVMLTNSQEMYTLVTRKLIDNEEIEDLEDKIYTLDKEINENEKAIRKRIVEHLIMQPSVDVSVCLTLMSVVKDAERLGDYCKNLHEIIDLLDKPIKKEIYEDLFNGTDTQLAEFFEKTKTAFMESDEDIAASSWDEKKQISKRCDEIIEKLAKSSLDVNTAVCFTLIARHFKRLSSHLTNIATSVILSVDELDYFDESRK